MLMGQKVSFLCFFVILSFSLFVAVAFARQHSQAQNQKVPAVKNAPASKKQFAELDLFSGDSYTEDTDEMDGSGRRSEDVSNKPLKEILDKFELDIVPEISEMIDEFVHLFDHVTGQDHFVAANKVLEAFLKALFLTLEPAGKVQPKLQGTLTPQMMDDLLNVQMEHFNNLLAKYPDISKTQLPAFLSKYVVVIFDTLKQAYRSVSDLGFNLNWSLIFILLPFLERLPTDIFFREHFAEILDIPGQLKQSIHDFLEDIFSSDQAHFVRMFVSFLKTVDWQKLLKTGKVEL